MDHRLGDPEMLEQLSLNPLIPALGSQMAPPSRYYMAPCSPHQMQPLPMGTGFEGQCHGQSLLSSRSTPNSPRDPLHARNDEGNQPLVRLQLSEQVCHACGFQIHDRFLLRVIDDYYHESCLRCVSCEKPLIGMTSCHVRAGQVFCKEDHTNFFVPKCQLCRLPLTPNDYIQRSGQNTFHSACFRCLYCGRHLKTGDQYFCVEGQIVCHLDYGFAMQHTGQTVMPLPLPMPPAPMPVEEMQFPPGPMPPFFADLEPSRNQIHSSHHHSNSKKLSKRPRTILNSSQRKAFKIAFEKGPKPTKKVREMLAKETGLSVRVVQVWFQNQRAKIKKIQRKQGNSVPSAPGESSTSVDSAFKHLSADQSVESDMKSEEGKSPMSMKSLLEDSDSEEVDLDSGRSSSMQRQSSSSSIYVPSALLSEMGTKEDPMDKLYHMHDTYFAYT